MKNKIITMFKLFLLMKIIFIMGSCKKDINQSNPCKDKETKLEQKWKEISSTHEMHYNVDSTFLYVPKQGISISGNWILSYDTITEFYPNSDTLNWKILKLDCDTLRVVQVSPPSGEGNYITYIKIN